MDGGLDANIWGVDIATTQAHGRGLRPWGSERCEKRISVVTEPVHLKGKGYRRVEQPRKKTMASLETWCKSPERAARTKTTLAPC